MYSAEVAYKVLETLKRYEMFPPHKIHAGKLTKNRFVLANKQTSEVFVDAYSEKDVFGIDMASGDSRTSDDFWRVDWGFTYYKNSKLLGSCKFLPWNTLTIQSTYGRLENDAISHAFMSCVRDLILLLDPFYASIDDLGNKVYLMGKTRDKHFVPDQVQEIFWGNYWGPDHCQRYGTNQLFDVAGCNIETIGKGVFFSLSNSMLENKSQAIDCLRKQIKSQYRYLI